MQHSWELVSHINDRYADHFNPSSKLWGQYGKLRCQILCTSLALRYLVLFFSRFNDDTPTRRRPIEELTTGGNKLMGSVQKFFLGFF